MKKILFLVIISIGFGIMGFSMNYEKPTENNKIHKMQPNEDEKKVKAESNIQMHNSVFLKQNVVKPYWECWAFNIENCASGFVCAETSQQANHQIFLILVQYCMNKTECD